MVIGVEGNVHVGKTTYINNNFKDYDILKEIEFNGFLNPYNRQLHYINKECERKKNQSDRCVLDRTIISIIIYTIYSQELSINEKTKLLNCIKIMLKKGNFIIPDYVYHISYPYKLICNNHQRLSLYKGTQSSLINYEYYLFYNMFFANKNIFYKGMVNYDNYRQINIYDNLIYNNLFAENKVKSKVLLDGSPAIGKSTIGKAQDKYQYVEEFKYKKYDLTDYSNQIESIINRINLLKYDNIICDTSFLMGITHLFYNSSVDKCLKLEMLKEIVSNVNLNQYCSKIIYLVLDKKKLIERKNGDMDKQRKHFYDNLQYLESEINFYRVLKRSLGALSNIDIIDANKSVEDLIKIICNIEDKPLLLSDLFYEIEENVKRGKI